MKTERKRESMDFANKSELVRDSLGDLTLDLMVSPLDLFPGPAVPRGRLQSSLAVRRGATSRLPN